MVISDSAINAHEYEGLVMRGCVVLLAEAKPLDAGAEFRCHVIGWYSKKHDHVVRSTYAAELHSLLDAINQGIVIAYCLTEVMKGSMTALELATRFYTGNLAIKVGSIVDAKQSSIV